MQPSGRPGRDASQYWWRISTYPGLWSPTCKALCPGCVDPARLDTLRDRQGQEDKGTFRQLNYNVLQTMCRTHRVSALLDAQEDFFLKLRQVMVRSVVGLHLPADL